MTEVLPTTVVVWPSNGVISASTGDEIISAAGVVGMATASVTCIATHNGSACHTDMSMSTS